MPVDFMLVLVACMDALEARWSGTADRAERDRVRRLLDQLDAWLERCLRTRFTGRESVLQAAGERLGALGRRMEKLSRRRGRSAEVLGEISSVLERLDGWWAALQPED